MSDLAASFLHATGDDREVIADPAALYYGAKVDDSSLTPGKGPRLGTVSFDDWLKRTTGNKAA